MSIFKNLFRKEQPIKTYNDFWNWFESEENKFYTVVIEEGDIHKVFFSKLESKLNQLHDGFYFLSGMLDEDTVELVFTADGIIKNIAFVEELVNSAPALKGWKFTALKPALDLKDVQIEMGEFTFDKSNLSFYSNSHEKYPDEIDISIIYRDFKEESKNEITNGVFIFLDNYLGELNFAETIDSIEVIGKENSHQDLIPIEKLKDFLTWRQKEFIEKYEGLRYNTDNDDYSVFEAKLKSGMPAFLAINKTLLNWDCKASHPWILMVEIPYNTKSNSGLPDKNDFKYLDGIEDQIMVHLKDADGYLNLGRETAENLRTLFFACKDFRKPSLVLEEIKKESNGKITYDIFKDKYWQAVEKFNF